MYIEVPARSTIKPMTCTTVHATRHGCVLFGPCWQIRLMSQQLFNRRRRWQEAATHLERMEALPVHQHRKAPHEECPRGINCCPRRTTELLCDRDAEKVEKGNLRTDCIMVPSLLDQSHAGPSWCVLRCDAAVHRGTARTETMLARMDACSCQDAATSCQAPTASSRGTPLESLITVTSGRATALMISPQKPCGSRVSP